MKNIFEGVRDFILNDYISLEQHFKNLSDTQYPHSLFIGCSDSRVDPALITKSLPGELFVVRNIANIVPIYRESVEFLATTSAIEYALQILNIENIIICGHSNCGGCKALYLDDKSLEKIPHTKKWAELMSGVRKRVDELKIDNEAHRNFTTERFNIIEQMTHLLTYPYIKEKYYKGEVKIFGWHYIIETGEIFNFNKDTKKFEKIE